MKKLKIERTNKLIFENMEFKEMFFNLNYPTEECFLSGLETFQKSIFNNSILIHKRFKNYLYKKFLNSFEKDICSIDENEEEFKFKYKNDVFSFKRKISIFNLFDRENNKIYDRFTIEVGFSPVEWSNLIATSNNVYLYAIRDIERKIKNKVFIFYDFKSLKKFLLKNYIRIHDNKTGKTLYWKVSSGDTLILTLNYFDSMFNRTRIKLTEEDIEKLFKVKNIHDFHYKFYHKFLMKQVLMTKLLKD